MKKIVMLLSILALVVIALAPAAGSVSAQKFTAYITGTQVMNLGTLEASVTLEYYTADDGTASGGAFKTSASEKIPVSQSKTFFPTVTSFKGSMVISSSQPLGAVTNLQNSAKTAGGSYVGASEGALMVQIPLLMKGNSSPVYDTWFSVQAAGGTPADISIKYSDCAQPITKTVKANAAMTFYQASEACHTLKVFSAAITSTQPIVVVVVEENTQKIFVYNGFPGEAGDISTDLVMPLVNIQPGKIATGIQIQNTNSAEATVTVSYLPSIAGTACTETQLIPANSSKTFAQAAFAVTNPAGITTDCIVGSKFVGSARVSNNVGGGLLVGIVNQNGAKNGEAYGAFNPNLATPRVILPLLMDRNGGALWSTGFSVMNAGSAATYVQCTLSNLPAGVTYSPSGKLEPYQALTPNQSGQIGVKYVGSGTCTAYSDAGFTTIDTSAKLVAIVNETAPSTLYDYLMVYEGLSVSVP